MAHILDGDWTSKTFDAGTTINPDPPTFTLSIDEASGDLMAGSMHGTDPLTGSVRREGQLLRVEIHNANRRRVYEGVFCATIQPAGIMVMAGKRRSNVFFDDAGTPEPNQLVEPKDRKLSGDDLAKFFFQEQIIWVATKP